MQCKHCSRYYKSHQKLQEHVRKYCLKQKKYKCVSCEYRSRRKDHVLRHAKRKHCILYEQSRDDEESLFVIRNEADLSNDEEDGDADDHDADQDPEESAVGMDSDVAAALCEINFDFAGRDLTITAVPVLMKSEDDDDDYDEDG
ncbi:hypothetical protein KR018_003636 [Drosophila ironensis]|nr:hypothetical protein KR018_003636 [Drosophila ironensis]